MNLRDEFLEYCAIDAALPSVTGICGSDPVVVSRGDLMQLAAGAAAQLQAAGVIQGDRVILSLQNEVAFPQWFWGAQLIGTTVVPIEPLLSLRRKSSQLAHLSRVVSLTLPKVIVTSFASVLEDSDVPGIRLIRVQRGFSIPSSSHPIPNIKLEESDCAHIQLSSGSTGSPKGCVLSQRAVCTNARAMAETFGYRPGESTFNWMPLFHDFGLMVGVIAPVVGRMTSILLPVEAFVSSPATWLRRMSGIGPVHTAGPMSALALLRSRLASRTTQSFALQDVRSLICGAEPIYPRVAEEFLEAAEPYGFRADALYSGYGMAETTVLASGRKGLVLDYVNVEGPNVGSKVSSATASNHSAAFVSLGPAHSGASFRVVDDTGRLLPERHVGHLHLRSPSLMDGYLNAPEQTHAVLKDSWYSTGDIGYLVAGEFYFVTRSKELIVVAGRKFAPTDIDYAVSEKLGIPVGRVASFGHVNQMATESIVIVVETRSDDTEELLRFAGMACFERTGITPSSVFTCPIGTIPKTSSGKVKRESLRLSKMALLNSNGKREHAN
jgi:acyl-CoA synthetase (AMP-forming)/AMP-acid ligase II